MNITSVVLAVVIWLVCVFAALALFISRIKSVREDVEKVNGLINSYYDLHRETWFALAERVKKLEESKICIIDTDPDEAGETSLYAITKVGYSTVIVSLTEDELAVIDSFIDWADLEEDFSAVKLDKNYKAADWRNKK